jgi:methylated-DNA-[protein]-cysteine S-methyltransferase
MSYLTITSPIGDLTLFEEDGVLVAIEWGRVDGGEETPLLTLAQSQLEEYFDGQRQSFDLPLAPHGTAFQRQVWEALRQIPYGQAARYGELAKAVGSAPRAIGGACGRNPLPVIIPCHRVIGTDGSLGGYSGDGGIETKQFLLSLEGWRPS